MRKNEIIEYWIENSIEDLESAFAIFETKRYVWCLFIGHLSIEKLLKAIILQITEIEFPPKTHNLIKLAEKANIKLTAEQEEILADITRFNIEGRYPEYKQDLSKIADFEFTKKYLSIIKETHSWLKSLIK